MAVRNPWPRAIFRLLAFAATGAAAAWVATVHEAYAGQSPLMDCGDFLVALVILLAASTLISVRRDGFALLAGWYGLALAPIALFWNTSYASGHLAGLGLPVEVLTALLLAAPAFLAPRRLPALGVPVALALAAVPPLGIIGMSSPLLAAGALWPGGGFAALAAVLILFVLSAVRRQPALRWARITQILSVNAGLLMTVYTPWPHAPIDAWGMRTHFGEPPQYTLDPFYAYQDAFKNPILAALRDGARLVVTPEGVDPYWNEDQAFYWSNVTLLARRKHATVLVGAYRTRPGHPHGRQDGLVNLVTGHFHPNRLSVPFSMWRPWARSRIGSFDMTANAQPIQTPYGPAAFLICYEDNLIWPLAWQELHFKPALLISASDLWFATNGTDRVQNRSVILQARLWGLPLIRAVNHPAISPSRTGVHAP